MAENKVKQFALITGGSRGLGKGMARSLARAGIDVVLTCHSNKQEGDKVAEDNNTVRTALYASPC